MDPAAPHRHVMPIPGAVVEPAGRLGGVRTSRVTFIVLLALLGVFMAAGITYAGGRLVSQPIGLAAEPRDLSSSLTAPAPARRAPKATPAPVKQRVKHRKVKPRVTLAAPSLSGATPAPAPAPAFAAPSAASTPAAKPSPTPPRVAPVRTSTDDHTRTDRSGDSSDPAAAAPAPVSAPFDGHDYDGDDD